MFQQRFHRKVMMGVLVTEQLCTLVVAAALVQSVLLLLELLQEMVALEQHLRLQDQV
jgi:hypothetical protein